MGKQKIIRLSNLPIKSPLSNTILYFTALHYWGMPQWSYGVTGVLLVLMWGSYILQFFRCKQVDLFEEHKNTTANNKKSGFRKMLDKQLADAQKQREDLNDKK